MYNGKDSDFDYVCVCVCIITLLYTWNKRSFVNQLYFNKKRGKEIHKITLELG